MTFRKLLPWPLVGYLRVCCLWVVWGSLLNGPAISAREASDKNTYKIPSGMAITTLKEAARQSEVDIMFAADVAKDVRTNAIQGEFTPQEALDRMLAGTPLSIIKDQQTGAFAVIRNPASASSSPDPEDTRKRESEPETTPEMKPKKGLFNSIVSGVAAVLTFSTPQAQAQNEDEDIVTLEAFEIFGAAAEASVAKQRNSDIIGSYLSSDTLSELPDDDLGEALSRLAGVNVIGGQGNAEASVTIRGADGQYNSIQINGASPANARLASRNFDLNQIPSEMVSSVEVIKSITAEFPGDSIGGSVNVETANAFDMGRRIGRYKIEARNRDQGDLWGWGTNLVYADILSAFGGEKNFGMLFNVNYVDEELVGWSTQNRFMDIGQLNAGGNVANDPQRANLAEQTILEVNPDASIPIWDRFDPNEVRTTKDQFTFSGSFDLILNEKTSLYFRPWYQTFNDVRDSMAFRVDRLGTVLAGDYWFLDDSGNPIGNWEGDTFVRGTDGSGNLIVTPHFEANGTGNGATDGRQDRIVRNQARDGSTYTLDLGGETKLDDGLIEYRVWFSSDQSQNYSREWRFQERFRDRIVGDPLRIRLIDGSTPLPQFFTFEVDGRGSYVPTDNYNNVFAEGRDPSNVSPRFALEDVSEDVILASIDVEQEVNDFLTLKTGFRFRGAKRENDVTQLFYSPNAPARSVIPVGQFAAESNAGNFTLFDGKYADTAGPFVVAEPLFNYFFTDLVSSPDNWIFDRSDLRDVADTAELNEDVLAAYMQGTFRWNNFSLVTGLRVESTHLDTTWKPSNFTVDGSNLPGIGDAEKAALNNLMQEYVDEIGFTGPGGGFSFGDIVDDVNAKNDYDNLLPSAVFTYRAGDSGHVFRFAWTNTLTRPDYRELIPFNFGEANRALQAAGVLNFTNRDEEFDLGNPNLTEQTSENFDLVWEYYFGPQQRNTISIAAFKKKLDDFLQENVFVRNVEFLIDPEEPGLGTEIRRSTTNFWSNASTRNIEGLELTGYFNFEDLFPSLDFLHGFSFIPNYAYITGDQTDPIFDPGEMEEGNFVVIGEQFTDSLTNQASEIYNLQLFYERERFNVRLSYNYISKLQRTASTAAITDLTFDRAQENVDLSIQYRLFADKDFRLFMEADNLTDTPSDERYIGNTPGLYTTSYETIGRRYVFGVRGSF